MRGKAAAGEGAGPLVPRGGLTAAFGIGAKNIAGAPMWTGTPYSTTPDVGSRTYPWGSGYGGSVGGKIRKSRRKSQNERMTETGSRLAFELFGGALCILIFTFVISRSPVQVRALAPAK